MSGHSKWANIKHKKAVNDKIKSNVFGKYSRMITMAVIEGGGVTNPDHNVKLRLAIDMAHSENLPKDNIDRAIEKGLGQDKNLLKEVLYEAFDKAGVAFIIEATTDNPNRTLAEIRNVLERHGGKLGSQGSITHLFQKCGVINFYRKDNSEDDIFAFADKIDEIDIEEDDDQCTVIFPFEKIGSVKGILGSLKPSRMEISYRILVPMPIQSEIEKKHIEELMEALEVLDDVHRVFVNAVYEE